MSTHTPGPWHVGENRHNYDQLVRNHDNDPVAICNLAGYADSVGRANARLIAAAPEMLEALQFYAAEGNWLDDPAPEAWLGNVPGTAPAWADHGNKALAAIAKAKGEAA